MASKEAHARYMRQWRKDKRLAALAEVRARADQEKYEELYRICDQLTTITSTLDPHGRLALFIWHRRQ